MKFDLTNVKMAKKGNCVHLFATLLIDNTAVCNINDPGDGSEPAFDIINLQLFRKWEKAVSELPMIHLPAENIDLPVDKGLFIDLLHSAKTYNTEFTLLQDR
jgi:hypothetical protein